MKLYIVGGFLGSGKTTAIIAAAKQLMRQGQKVGVITNDQGKYLVDTAFFALSKIPTLEVTGGCFCTHYDDFGERLKQLKAIEHPDVIFAETIGSAANIVATVVKPLEDLAADGIVPSSYTIFTDARLLRLKLMGLPMPFADGVNYIFEKQIEEGNFLVINKIDLLKGSEVNELAHLAAERFPDKRIRLQNTLNAESVAGWVERLAGYDLTLPSQLNNFDNLRFKAAKAALTWQEESFTLHVTPGQGQAVVRRILQTIINALQMATAPIGHLKIIVQDNHTHAKLSFPTLSQPNWEAHIPNFSGEKLHILLNARVQLPADDLRTLLYTAIQQSIANSAHLEQPRQAESLEFVL